MKRFGLRRGAFRIAFVGALTAALVAALASVGGFGYAAGSAKTTRHKSKTKGDSLRTRTPAAFQYGRKALICHNGHTIFVSVNAVPAHLRHGDTSGPCP